MKPPVFSRRALGAWSALALTGALGASLWPVRAQAPAASPGAAREDKDALQGEAPLGRLSIAVSGQSSLYHLPLALADQLGYFRAEGLDVTLRNYAAGALAAQAVQEGAAEVCSGAFEHTLRQQARGHPYRAFVLQARAPQLALGVSLRALPNYRQLQDLAGQRIGVTSVGSSTHLAACVLLARAGVPASAVSFVEVGSDLAAMSALRSGRLQALCHTDPVMTLLAQKASLRIVGDLRSLRAAQEVFQGSMPASCLYAPQAFVNQYPAKVQALTNGMVRALKWLQTAAPADLAQTLPAPYWHGDRSVYLAAFGRVRETYSTNGVLPEDGGDTALRALSSVHPDLASARLDLGRTYTNAFVLKARQKFNV